MAIYIIAPECQPNRITEDEIMNKKLNKEISAQTTHDICKIADKTLVIAAMPCRLHGAVKDSF